MIKKFFRRIILKKKVREQFISDMFGVSGIIIEWLCEIMVKQKQREMEIGKYIHDDDRVFRVVLKLEEVDADASKS